MAILNIKGGREYVGKTLHRKGPVSEKTWKRLLAQGLPIGLAGDSPVVSTEAIDRWFERVADPTLDAGLGVARADSEPVPTTTPRKRGRPRKSR